MTTNRGATFEQDAPRSTTASWGMLAFAPIITALSLAQTLYPSL
jgi:hypothetical protein